MVQGNVVLYFYKRVFYFNCFTFKYFFLYLTFNPVITIAMNTNTPKVLLLIIIGVLVVNLAFNLFGSGKTLREAVKNLENARKSIDTALLQLGNAQTRLDSIQANLDRQREVIKGIYVRTELMDLEKKVKDARNKAQADSIKERIANLKDFQPADSTIIPIVNL